MHNPGEKQRTYIPRIQLLARLSQLQELCGEIYLIPYLKLLLRCSLLVNLSSVSLAASSTLWTTGQIAFKVLIHSANDVIEELS